ncbi:hypothetical protein PUN28_016247 [Cardiocondyla obscurior]|uniref:Uncharacterized protein n=1 Tax=Cardiocondyla obscurior TaxID=286306 RepID=A0AAW2ETY5_9HYME
MARIARELPKLIQDILTIPGIHEVDNRLDSTVERYADPYLRRVMYSIIIDMLNTRRINRTRAYRVRFSYIRYAYKIS